METYKIYGFLDKVAESYKEPTERVTGLLRDPKDIIRTVEFYSNSQFLSGNEDGLGREKPFYNIGNYRVTVAKTATDLDVKDIHFDPDKLQYSVQAMLINHELYKYFKESKFSLTLNEMGLTRPKYGGVLVKKHEHDSKLEIGVVDWTNVDFDPGDVLGGAIIETHHLQPSELMAQSDVWYDVDEVMHLYAKHNKGKVGKITIKSISGEFPMTYFNECDKDGYKEKSKDKRTYKRMCFYIACIGEKKILVYHELEGEILYKYLPWEKVGKGLGRGIWEDGFQAQVWSNDAIITGKNAHELTAKVVGKTDSQKISGNAITGVDHGHIFEMEKGATFEFMNLGPSQLPEVAGLIKLWDEQYNKTASTFDANTGDEQPSGTPLGSTKLLNQVANSPFEYRREEWGIFLNEILDDWILPFIKKRILKPHYLISEFNNEELEMIDEAISAFESNKKIKERMLDGKNVYPEEQAMMIDQVKRDLQKSGAKREVKISEDFLDVEGKLTANITNELKNKMAVLQSLDSIFKTVVSTYNPQTGTYAALEDKRLAQIFGQIVELSGAPISSSQLRSRPAAPTNAIMPPTNGKVPTTV